MNGTCLGSSCSGYLSGGGGQLFTSSLSLLFSAQCLITENWPSDASKNVNNLTFDYIVVGAGSAGCVVASRLTEDKCVKVLLVEAGGDPPFESLVPETAYNMFGSPVDWSYRTENDSFSCKGKVGGRCGWPRGKCLGGSSSINGMIYVRGNRKNYDDIAKAGNVGWDYDRVFRYFLKSENLSLPAVKNDPLLHVYHNYSGPLGVSQFDAMNPLEAYVVKGYEELGFKSVEDINSYYHNGIVNVMITVEDGIRESTARAYLVPARDRKNLVIFKNSLVTKILFKRKTATGVEIRLENGSTITARATKEVIVCAGAINTPQLLMLSGIGLRKHLEEFHIPVLADLAVGQNLNDHIAVPIIMNVNVGESTRSAAQLGFDAAEYIAFQRGYYARRGYSHNPYLTLCLFTDIDNPLNSTYPNMQFYHVNFVPNSEGLKGFCYFGAGYTDEICNSMVELNTDKQILIILPEILDAKSRGNISLASTDPTKYPKIYSHYLSKREDMDSLLKGIDLVCNQLVNTPTFQEIGAQVNEFHIKECSAHKFPSREYWSCYIQYMVESGYHPMGTAKMGPKSDPSAVVDPELRVHGIKKLRVVDASVIPSAISGNINAAVIMIAEKASDLIKHANPHKGC